MTSTITAEIEPPELRLGILVRIRAWAGVHRQSLLLATPLLAAVGIVHAWGMNRSPGFVDDEGTYTAQAWAVEHWGQLAHYTYWYDHPPLGWIQIAAWTSLTDAFGRLPSAVVAGREAMLVAKLVGAALLFVLCRRLGFRRGFALLAVALYGLSPLAIALTRSVYLDNIAVPWLLGAFVLALSPRRHLAAAAASGLCFAIAVLSKETILVLLPAWAWIVWSHADRRNRTFVMTLALPCAAAAIAFYPLVALLRGEFVGSADRVSLMWAVRWQLFDRSSSGSVFDPASSSRAIVSQWLTLDSLLLVAGVVAVVPAIFSRRLRPIAAVLVIQVVVALRGGYLPFPHVIVMLPFAAVLVAGVLNDLWSRHRQIAAADGVPTTSSGGRPLALRRAVAIGGLVAVTGCASATWPHGVEHQLTAAPAAAMAQAVQWVDDHVDHDDTVVVHDAAWVDLVQRGFNPDRVLWFYKLDLDPGVQLPHGWRDIDYLLLAENMPNLDESPTTRDAIEHSELVVSFGSGDDRVVVREVGAERRQRVTNPAPPVETSELTDAVPAPPTPEVEVHASGTVESATLGPIAEPTGASPTRRQSELATATRAQSSVRSGIVPPPATAPTPNRATPEPMPPAPAPPAPSEPPVPKPPATTPPSNSSPGRADDDPATAAGPPDPVTDQAEKDEDDKEEKEEDDGDD